MTSRTWRGEGGKFERWFRGRLRQLLRGEQLENLPKDAADFFRRISKPGWPDWFCESVVDAYAREAHAFASWREWETWSGPGYSTGRWVMDYQRIRETLVDVLNEIRATQRAEELASVESIDQWLERFEAGTLPSPVEEAHAGNLVRRPSAYYQRRNRLAARWPRLCTECGHEFRPTRRTTKRCEECRGGRQRARS